MPKAQNAVCLLEILRVHVAVVAVQNKDRLSYFGNTYRRSINLVSQKLGAIDRVLSQNPMVILKTKHLGIDVVSRRKWRSWGAKLERFPERIIEDTIRPRHHCIGGAVFFGEVFGDFGKD